MAHRQALLSAIAATFLRSGPSAPPTFVAFSKIYRRKAKDDTENFCFPFMPVPLTNASFIGAESSKQRAEGNTYSLGNSFNKISCTESPRAESQLYASISCAIELIRLL